MADVIVYSMIKMGISELIERAEQFNIDKTDWHHHFLTPKCFLNESEEYRIILEDEARGYVYYSGFREKPIHELKKLEGLFFNR